MDGLTWVGIALLWTLFAFGAGIVVHRQSTREQRRLLKQYRSREGMSRQLNRPIEAALAAFNAQPV